MSFEYSRRDLLAGVLATGTLAAVGTYFSKGGRPAPSVELRMFSGDDPTGARDLLVNIWNGANPNVQVKVLPGVPGTTDQHQKMISAIQGGNGVDVLNLDIIDIPFFQKSGYLTPVEPNPSDFLDKTLLPSRLGDSTSSTFWAVPFTSDVGMFFARTQATDQQIDASGALFTTVIGSHAFDQTQQIAGQLGPLSSASYEAFAVNVMEHALAWDPDIFHGDAAVPANELERWQHALQPLRDAKNAGRLALCDGEDKTEETFRTKTLAYMRNWPVKYRLLQQNGDADAARSRIKVGSLPVGILGGQSLAIPSNSRNKSAATDFIRYMTSLESQQILASYGTPSVFASVYDDKNLQAFIPHLQLVRGAIEKSQLRPIHANYYGFSAAFVELMQKVLSGSAELSTAALQTIQNTLK